MFGFGARAFIPSRVHGSRKTLRSYRYYVPIPATIPRDPMFTLGDTQTTFFPTLNNTHSFFFLVSFSLASSLFVALSDPSWFVTPVSLRNICITSNRRHDSTMNGLALF